MKLRGPHNRLNADAALHAAEIFGALPAHLEAVLASFAGLPHRLEDLGVHGGVRWINDSIATAPEAAVAALDAFGGEVATYIGGGTDRGFDFAPLARALVARARPERDPAAARRPVHPRRARGGRSPSRGRARTSSPSLAEAVAPCGRGSRPQDRRFFFSRPRRATALYKNFEERGNVFRGSGRAL